MARKVTQVKFEKFVKVAEKLGMQVSTKKGETKVFPVGGSAKRSLAIPNTKLVTRIALVGFESAEFGVTHPKPPAATVTQMLDFTQPELLVTKAFYLTCKALIAQVAAEAAIPAEPTVTETPAEQPAEQAAEQVEVEAAAG